MAGKAVTLDIGSKGTHHPNKQDRRIAADTRDQESPSKKHTGGSPGAPRVGLLQDDRADKEIPSGRKALVLCSSLGWSLEHRLDLPSFNQ